ncbi:MAG: internalization-related competence protein ComEC/Rec2 [Firmicutes bacterium]|nr:internalization-related competence protein ComEC/Rec2 [Bacillota bacterium]
MNHPLIFINCLVGAFVLGIFCVGQIVLSLSFVYGVIVVLFFSSIIFLYRNDKRVNYSVIALFFLLGFLRCTHDLMLSPNDISHEIGRVVHITGRIVDTPRIKVIDEDKVSIRYVVEAKKVEFYHQQKTVNGKVLIHIAQKSRLPIAVYGDQVTILGEVQSLHGYNNPGLIDSVAMLKRQGITAKLKAEKNSAVVRQNEESNFRRTIDKLRGKILIAMENVMPKQDAAAVFAMLFGGYGGIKPELVAAFTATGIVHILSVSGSHISLVAGTMQKVGSMLRLSPMVTAILVIVIVIGYAVFSGCVPPVVRSATMGIMTFIALAIGREKDACIALALVSLLMLAISPQLIHDISFQLSFSATAGMLYISPVMTKLFIKLPKYIAINLAITISAQLSVLPFLAWYFNSVSISSLLANILAVPIIENMIIFGLLGVIIGIVIPIAQALLFIFCSMAIGLVYHITSVVAAIPNGNLYLPSIGILGGTGYYLMLFSCLSMIESKTSWWKIYWKKYKKGFLTFLAILCFLYIIYQKHSEPVRMHFIDVGQGDAMVLTTPHGKAIVIDTGGVLALLGDFDVGERVVVPYLKHYGITKIEYLLLTHAHEDHAGGAAAIRKHFPVEHVMIGKENRNEYARVFKTNLQDTASFIVAYTGETFIVDSVKVEILQALDAVKAGTGNEVSNVFKITYGKHSFLITGDLDANGEKELLKNQANLKSTVLKVAHHGSKTSSAAEFIQKVAPAYAVISVGANNNFGHPNQQVLERLKENKAAIIRTDECGAIVFESDGKTLSVDTFIK